MSDTALFSPLPINVKEKDRLYRDNIMSYWFTITVLFKNGLYIKVLGHWDFFKCDSYSFLTPWENIFNIIVTPDFSILQDTSFPSELPTKPPLSEAF